MQDSAKYLIHAEFRANGVVERSDVVGAIFGQTEGLLGEELDLRDLQESSKVGRIEVEMSSEGGRSFGTVTIASGLDRVETAVLAAGLETIDRIGPCRADFEVSDLEDARSAKRREVVDRATELLADFEDSTLTSHELVEEVRRNVRVADITDYEGYPAGPRVADSDAIIVVEGRADVLQLLRYGIKTAIAVEGTDIPDPIADLSRNRTVTAFLDGDRGGDLIMKELAQVGNVDYVAFAPAGKSVEDLDRDEVLSALRKKAPYEDVAEASSPRAVVEGEMPPEDRIDADGGSGAVSPEREVASGGKATSPDTTEESCGSPEPSSEKGTEGASGTPSDSQSTPGGEGDEASDAGQSDQPGEAGQSDQPGEAQQAQQTSADQGHEEASDTQQAGEVTDAQRAEEKSDSPATEPEARESTKRAGDSDTETTEDGTSEPEPSSGEEPAPRTLVDHVDAIIGDASGQVRLLDGDFRVVSESGAETAFETLESTEEAAHTVVIDGELTQRLLDVAAQRDIPQIIARSEGEFVKQPTGVRVRTAEAF
jgi:DNA primase